MTPLEAAQLVASDYGGTLAPLEGLDVAGVQCGIVRHEGRRVMVIRGTDEARDWLVNLTCGPSPAVEAGDRYRWHAGFLQHGRVAYAFAKGRGVELVIGHSLGAAAAAIVAVSLGIPAICLGSPRPLYGDVMVAERDLVTNWCRPDDLVAQLPPSFIGFRHVGVVHWLAVRGRAGGLHGIVHYLDALADLEVMPDARLR